MDNDKGGSGSNTGGSPDVGADGVKSKTLKEKMDALSAENVALKQELERTKNMLAEVTKELDEVNSVREAEEKENLISQILPLSNCKADQLAGKTSEQLKEMLANLKMAVLPKANSVRFGVMGLDISDREKGLTVGDLSVVTAEKRKAQGVA